jgi:signal peptidase
MEPAIPTGSLVYIKEMDPAEVEEDEVIAFYAAKDSASIITHRVVENRVVMGEFITKGDANETQDMNPASYDEFIGKVVLSIPVVGQVAQIFTSYAGKIAATSLIGIAILLEIIAVLFEKKGKYDSNDEDDEADDEDDDSDADEDDEDYDDYDDGDEDYDDYDDGDEDYDDEDYDDGADDEDDYENDES